MKYIYDDSKVFAIEDGTEDQYTHQSNCEVYDTAEEAYEDAICIELCRIDAAKDELKTARAKLKRLMKERHK